ncbi:MAG: hypothetical protein KJO55_02945, partial [Gammaproteobacteria bacterium]|nr:hypothetical protein [Gammaproteobacteria bacterium]
PTVNRAPPVNTTIKLVCDECAGASCDANRLALRAIQAIHDGSYSDDCANGCVNAENEMHSRVIDMIWDVGPTSGGFTFKIEAKQAEFELQLVHAKLTPIWGDQFQVVIPGLNISVPVLSWLHGYRIHILSPDGQWSSTAADLNQPRPYLSPPWVPYPSCHPAGSSSGTGSGNGYVGNNDTGSNHGGGCIVSLPRPLP